MEFLNGWVGFSWKIDKMSGIEFLEQWPFELQIYKIKLFVVKHDFDLVK